MELIETINNITAFIGEFDNIINSLADSVGNLASTVADTINQII